MFSGITTREGHNIKQKIISQDVNACSSLVFKKLMEETCGDMQIMKTKLPLTLDATIWCYSGNCSKCRRHSKVCGEGHKANWRLNSKFLGLHNVTQLNMTENDKEILLEITKIKLSLEAAEWMKLNTDTQKCESVNRSFSVTVPKTVNYSRNFGDRVGSTIHSRNNGLGQSLLKKVTNIGSSLSPATVCALDHCESVNRSFLSLIHI